MKSHRVTELRVLPAPAESRTLSLLGSWQSTAPQEVPHSVPVRCNTQFGNHWLTITDSSRDSSRNISKRQNFFQGKYDSQPGQIQSSFLTQSSPSKQEHLCLVWIVSTYLHAARLSQLQNRNLSYLPPPLESLRMRGKPEHHQFPDGTSAQSFRQLQQLHVKKHKQQPNPSSTPQCKGQGENQKSLSISWALPSSKEMSHI